MINSEKGSLKLLNIARYIPSGDIISKDKISFNFVYTSLDLVKAFKTRFNLPNSGYLPNTGVRPLYTMISHFTASGRITN